MPEIRPVVYAALRKHPDPAVPPLADDRVPVDQLIYDAFYRKARS